MKDLFTAVTPKKNSGSTTMPPLLKRCNISSNGITQADCGSVLFSTISPHEISTFGSTDEEPVILVPYLSIVFWVIICSVLIASLYNHRSKIKKRKRVVLDYVERNIDLRRHRFLGMMHAPIPFEHTLKTYTKPFINHSQTSGDVEEQQEQLNKGTNQNSYYDNRNFSNLFHQSSSNNIKTGNIKERHVHRKSPNNYCKEDISVLSLSSNHHLPLIENVEESYHNKLVPLKIINPGYHYHTSLLPWKAFPLKSCQNLLKQCNTYSNQSSCKCCEDLSKKANLTKFPHTKFKGKKSCSCEWRFASNVDVSSSLEQDRKKSYPNQTPRLSRERRQNALRGDSFLDNSCTVIKETDNLNKEDCKERGRNGYISLQDNVFNSHCSFKVDKVSSNSNEATCAYHTKIPNDNVPADKSKTEKANYISLKTDIGESLKQVPNHKSNRHKLSIENAMADSDGCSQSLLSRHVNKQRLSISVIDGKDISHEDFNFFHDVTELDFVPINPCGFESRTSGLKTTPSSDELQIFNHGLSDQCAKRVNKQIQEDNVTTIEIPENSGYEISQLQMLTKKNVSLLGNTFPSYPTNLEGKLPSCITTNKIMSTESVAKQPKKRLNNIFKRHFSYSKTIGKKMNRKLSKKYQIFQGDELDEQLLPLSLRCFDYYSNPVSVDESSRFDFKDSHVLSGVKDNPCTVSPFADSSLVTLNSRTNKVYGGTCRSMKTSLIPSPQETQIFCLASDSSTEQVCFPESLL